MFWWLVGFFTYHFLMNRTVMMRDCCVEHFKTHLRECKCNDCVRDRE